ncbi:MAG: DUF3570 domain-containing protein [Burkholderiaceae bacterium]|nr:DUF3570 domain-containing protein [Burkholderiaceae bacterium]
MAANKSIARLLAALAGLLGGVFAPSAARAATLPEDRAEALVHIYNGGGTTASGPAVLVRKSLYDKVSLTGSLYIDAVSNASIDVVTTASPYKERRNDYGLALDYAVRDSLITLAVGASKEPDYSTRSLSLDIAQETFGGMTTVNLGFTRAADEVGKIGEPGFFDQAKHWQYRVGVTQILTPKWLASVNLEAVSDTGFLGNTYRVARVFGAAVPERHPRTRSSRAVKFRAIGDMGSRDSVRAEYRYFWDTWDIKAHTFEAGYSRYLGGSFLADGFIRYYTQSAALFYSDNAQSETTYVSRNRQLADFDNFVIGGKLTFDWKKQPGLYDLKANAGIELFNLNYKNFTDIRNGSAYSLRAVVLQLYLTATY